MVGLCIFFAKLVKISDNVITDTRILIADSSIYWRFNHIQPAIFLIKSINHLSGLIYSEQLVLSSFRMLPVFSIAF